MNGTAKLLYHPASCVCASRWISFVNTNINWHQSSRVHDSSNYKKHSLPIWHRSKASMKYLQDGARRAGYLFSTHSRCMQASRIDGKAIAIEMKNEIKAQVKQLVDSGHRAPHLTVLLVGNDPASIVYVRNKARAAEYTGINCEVLRLPQTVSQKALLKEIDFLNSLPDVDGILIQLPLPSHINERVVCDAVRPDRDVDGFNVLNIGRCCVDHEAFMPATPAGVLEIIRRLGVQTFGKNAVVVGRSKHVGMPIAMHIHSENKGHGGAGDATTTICHRNTPKDHLTRFTLGADIIITATGVPGLITSDMVSDGAVVIDVGITRVEDDKGRTRLVGDVDFAGVSKKASMITPVPGGVGPVTVAMVIKNTLIAYKKNLFEQAENTV